MLLFPLHVCAYIASARNILAIQRKYRATRNGFIELIEHDQHFLCVMFFGRKRYSFWQYLIVIKLFSDTFSIQQQILILNLKDTLSLVMSCS